MKRLGTHGTSALADYGSVGGRQGIVTILLVGIGVASFVFGASTAAEKGGDGVPDGPAPQTVKKSMWGPTFLESDGTTPLFPVYRDLGVGLYSNSVRWDWTAPKKPKNPTDPKDPAYVWPSYFSQSVNQAKKNGMEVNALVLGAPKWANGGKSWPWTPTDPKDYADFLTAMSKRYPEVDHWMIWGEPNRNPNYKPSTPVKEDNATGPLSKGERVAPENYAKLLDAAYGAIKGVDPKDSVIGGNTYTSAGMDDINPYQWIRYMKLPDGSRPRMDMWGHNPFGFDEPEFVETPSREGVVAFADLERLTDELDKTFKGQPPLKLFLAEWGVPNGFKDLDLNYVRSDEDADEWISAGFELAREWDRIYSLGWIHPVDTDRSSQGLLDVDGKKKPTYDSYKGS